MAKKHTASFTLLPATIKSLANLKALTGLGKGTIVDMAVASAEAAIATKHGPATRKGGK
jgi:hypothetical protein